MCKHASNVSFARKSLGYTGVVHPDVVGLDTQFRFGCPSTTQKMNGSGLEHIGISSRMWVETDVYHVFFFYSAVDDCDVASADLHGFSVEGF